MHSRKMRRGGSNIRFNVSNSNDSDEIDPDYAPLLYSNASDEMDPDYALFLNSVTIVDDHEEYMRVKNTTNTAQVEENTSNSSDSESDVIVGNEGYNTTNTSQVEENMSNSSDSESDLIVVGNEDYDDSQFRTRLMECLDKPYDYEEYKNLMSKLYNKNQKERHFKKRQRVVESYHSRGFTTPYCEMYPDIAEAIDKVSTEKPRVLFLLRGFFFWLENVSHMGSFQPWHDESCLELLGKM